MSPKRFQGQLALLLALVAPLSLSESLGMIDEEPVLEKAMDRLGLVKNACYEMQGSAKTAILGKQASHGRDMDWPFAEDWQVITRYLDTGSRVIVDTVERKPGKVPANWRFGAGWLDGAPLQDSESQTFVTTPDASWARDGDTEYQVSESNHYTWHLDVLLNPLGFLNWATQPEANTRAFQRWELVEMGRDGPTLVPRKVFVLVVDLPGGQSANATLDEDFVIRRLQSRAPHPVLGDMNFENEFLGPDMPASPGGIRMPSVWHHHQGWDDNRQEQSISTGHNAFHGIFGAVARVECRRVPSVSRNAVAPLEQSPIDISEPKGGVFLVSGKTHNNMIVEFKDYVVVIDAPVGPWRSLKTIDFIKNEFPGKPIRYVVSLHHQYDHIAGLREYVHMGATVVTHHSNLAFLKRDVINYHVRQIQPDLLAEAPPTELAEGNIYETLFENYAIVNGGQSLILHYVQPYKNIEGMLLAYHPGTKILFQDDLLSTGSAEAFSSPEGRQTLISMVETLELDVELVIPAHGDPIRWKDVLSEKASRQPSLAERSPH